MSATATWAELNQWDLMGAVGRVRGLLRRHAAPDDPAPEDAPEPFAGSALDQLAGAFGLTPFERDIVVLCAGMELDGGFAQAVAAAQGHPRRDFPTFGLALAVLPEAHWSALGPSGPLRRWRLVLVDATESLTAARLRVDERILHFLAGVEAPDERLLPLLEPEERTGELVPSHRALAAGIADRWRASGGGPVLQLCGPPAPEKRAIAAHVCRLLGCRASVMSAAALPAFAAELDSLARLWQREAVLARAVPFLDADDFDPPQGAREDVVAAFVARLEGPVFVATRERRQLRRRASQVVPVAAPTGAEQRGLWAAALAGISGLSGHVDRAAGHFRLSPSGIETVAAEVRDGEGEPGPRLWAACRAAARGRLGHLAQRREPSARWDDLVLPEAAKGALRQIGAQVRQRTQVYENWGLGRGARGLGVTALFVGPSGTGKTMAAEVLAGELNLDLACIDLSQVVNKYIGETEKNLARVFDAAEAGGAVLLFDEADALFGKRSEVKNSHDRYANLEVGYLLQRMEAYRGLAILTTNMKDSLDQAFLRRLRFVVRFPFPDANLREAIWRRAFPTATPTEGLDPRKLARLNVAGGHIRNIALAGAFLAADSGQPVRMSHLLEAARSEYAKLERPLTEAEIGGWL